MDDTFIIRGVKFRLVRTTNFWKFSKRSLRKVLPGIERMTVHTGDPLGGGMAGKRWTLVTLQTKIDITAKRPILQYAGPIWEYLNVREGAFTPQGAVEKAFEAMAKKVTARVEVSLEEIRGLKELYNLMQMTKVEAS